MTDKGLHHESTRWSDDNAEFQRQMRIADAYLWAIVCICLFSLLVGLLAMSSPGVK